MDFTGVSVEFHHTGHFWSPGIVSSISAGPNQERGLKPAEHYNSPDQPGWATVFFPVVYFPYCTSSQQVFLPVSFLFPSFLFLPPTFFLFYKEEFGSYKSSNTQHLSPGGLLFTRQHLHGTRWDPLSAIDRRCCCW